MLERSSSRRRVSFGAQILVGAVAAAFSFDFAFAQSPAASGVYNRAATLGAGGFGPAQGRGTLGTQGRGPGGFGAQGQGVGFGARQADGAANGDFGSAFALKPQVVDEPEYVYSKHEENAPVVSIEPLAGYSEQTGQDAFLTASADKTAHIFALEGKVDDADGEWKITNGRTRKVYKDEHRQGLTDATLSPDGKYVLTSSYDEKGRLWTIDNEENIRAYLGAKDRLWAISVLPSGAHVAAACNDGRVYFWESLTVKRCFDEDEGGANIPNREDAQKKGPGFEEIGHEGPIFDLAFSSDSQYCATAGADGTVRVWNVGVALEKWLYKSQTRDRSIDATPREMFAIKGHQDKIYSVCFSSDGGYLLTASRDKTARVWNLATGEEVCRFVGHNGAVRKAIFVDNGGVLTASDDGTVRLWAIGAPASNGAGAGSDAAPLGGMNALGPGGEANRAEFGPSGASLGSGGEAQTKAVGKPTRAPGKTKGTELVSFDAKSPVFSVAATLDGAYVLGGCADGTVKIWRVPGMTRVFNLFGDPNIGAADGLGGQNGGPGLGGAGIGGQEGGQNGGPGFGRPNGVGPM